jgi:hypothetical protein
VRGCSRTAESHTPQTQSHEAGALVYRGAAPGRRGESRLWRASRRSHNPPPNQRLRNVQAVFARQWAPLACSGGRRTVERHERPTAAARRETRRPRRCRALAAGASSVVRWHGAIAGDAASPRLPPCAHRHARRPPRRTGPRRRPAAPKRPSTGSRLASRAPPTR